MFDCKLPVDDLMEINYILRSKLQFICAQFDEETEVILPEEPKNFIESGGNYDLDTNSVLRIVEIVILVSIGFCVISCASYSCIKLKDLC